MALAGAYGVAVYPFGRNPFPSPTLDGLVDAEDQRPCTTVQVSNQHGQKDVTHLERRPAGTVDHMMVEGKVVLLAKSHDAQHRGDSALARCQNCAYEHELGLIPGPGMKKHLKWLEQVYNGCRQSEHFRPLVGVWSSLPCHSSFGYPVYKVQLMRYQELCNRIAQLSPLTTNALIDELWPPQPENSDIRGIALDAISTTQTNAELFEEVVNQIIHPELPKGQDDVVRIMSLHKSKGLTAKSVVVAGCVVGALPTFRANLTSAERQRVLEEARRLFYVGITRTTKTLVLSSAAMCDWGEAKKMGFSITRRVRDGNGLLQASPFLSELGPAAPRAISGQKWGSNLGF